MAIQLILCLEANKKSGTDYAYINEVLRRFYVIDNSVKLTPIYMGGKPNYNHRSVVNEISNKISLFKHGDTKVIYITDTDLYESRPEDKLFLEKVSKYCEANGYDHIWFCHDVEEVFWGEKISSGDKVKKAGVFKNKKLITTLDESRLRSRVMKAGYSNILTVLDKYLTEKGL